MVAVSKTASGARLSQLLSMNSSRHTTNLDGSKQVLVEAFPGSEPFRARLQDDSSSPYWERFKDSLGS